MVVLDLVLVADVVWAINFIIDDWYLLVRWFAHRRAVQAAMLCGARCLLSIFIYGITIV